jgi:predicted hotdog family 3-hydroxylacyl-ACP dehydratase
MVRGFSLVSAVGRIAIGVGMLAAPELALRALGFSEVNAATIAVSRIAGVRDLVLGAVTLAAIEDPGRLRAATIANAVADAGDTGAFALAIRAEERTAGLRGVATALPATLAGLWMAWRLS